MTAQLRLGVGQRVEQVLTMRMIGLARAGSDV
jgi:hypothetical protein